MQSWLRRLSLSLEGRTATGYSKAASGTLRELPLCKKKLPGSFLYFLLELPGSFYIIMN